MFGLDRSSDIVKKCSCIKYVAIIYWVVLSKCIVKYSTSLMILDTVPCFFPQTFLTFMIKKSTMMAERNFYWNFNDTQDFAQ